MSYPLLQTIDDPHALRRLSRAELRPLADELRAYVLDSVVLPLPLRPRMPIRAPRRMTSSGIRTTGAAAS